MTNPAVRNAAQVAPAIEVYERESNVTSEALKLPAEFRNGWITIQAITTGVFVRFGRATLTVTNSATSAVTADEPAVATDAGVLVPAGEERAFDLSRVVRHNDPPATRVWLAHVTASGTGRIKFWRSSGRV